MEIKRRSRHDWQLFTGFYDAEGTYPELKAMQVTELNALSVERRYGTVIRAGISVATTRIPNDGFDALLVSCDGLGSFVNFANRGLPSACLCFTPLRAVYDSEYRVRHLSRNPAARALQAVAAAGYRRLDKRAWSRYRHVFCISNEVKRRVLEGGLCASERIEVAYPGIDSAQRQLSDRCESFFFLPGRIMWTKNIELAIDAFRRFRARVGTQFSLKIAGMVDNKSRGYYHALRQAAGDDPSIEFVLNPTDAEMRDYYSRCYAVLFTAFNEDLGITPMEAGAVGKPVIAVDRGGPREIVVNGETGLLVEPHAEHLCAAMSKLAADPEESRRLGLANFHRSKLYTWERFIGSIDGYFDQLATSRHSHPEAQTAP